MSTANTEWTVRPHGPLEEIDSGILAVVGEGTVPSMDLPRRMTVVRLRDGRLVIWSPVSLDNAGMATLESYGRPAFLVVPSAHHRLGAPAWKMRFPALQVVTPPGSRTSVGDVVSVDSTAPDFGDSQIQFIVVPGTRDEEAALLIRRRGGTTLVLDDLVDNVRHASGFGGWLLRRMGLAGDEPQVPTTVASLVVKDKSALRAQLLRWAEIPDLKRIVVSHGDLIESNPRGVLRELASSLA